MAEKLYQYLSKAEPAIEKAADLNIRWLGVEDYAVYARHLALCGQRQLSEERWKQICDADIPYCGIFEDGEMVARACREIISDEKWEVADVRVAREYRNRGYATQICCFVMRYILSHDKTPTIRTEEDNFSMLRVIEKLGFVPWV